MISGRKLSRVLAAGTLWLAMQATAGDTPGGQGFATPALAVDALYALIGQGDRARVEAVFGPGSYEIFSSGDLNADKEDFQRVKDMIRQRVAFKDYGSDTRVPLFGDRAWPWPVPLVKRDGLWYFDTAAGEDELLNRRIGHNELWALTALREIVEAQREYRATGHDGRAPAYAQRFRSSPGRQDGLWWAAAPGQAESPLGDLLANSEVGTSATPQPFHGYYYRILESQGGNAPGGARSYLDKQGLMTGGFAVLAWPAKHDNSGVMTFVVSDRGLIFQKDLGPETNARAAAITAFDPDSTWTPTGDSITEAND